MAKKNEKQPFKQKDVNELKNIQMSHDQLLNKISAISNGSDNQSKEEIDNISHMIDDIINDEINKVSSLSGADLGTFLTQVFNERDNNYNIAQKSIEDIFNNTGDGLVNFLIDQHKNKNIMLSDLEVISSYLFQMQEAVDSMRDAIVTSDDLSQRISRNITFNNVSIDDETKQSYIRIIENLEKELKIPHMVKNHLIPKTLTFGKYSVHTMPYDKLLTDFERNKNKKMDSRSRLESSLFSDVALESVLVFDNTNKSDTSIKKDKKFSTYLENFDLSDIEICNDDSLSQEIFIEKDELEYLLESSSDIFGADFDKSVKKSIGSKNKVKTTVDGTYDLNEKVSDYSNIKGCHIKLIDPRKLIPIKILNKIVGYYYIHELDGTTSKPTFSNNLGPSLSSGLIHDKTENNFISVLADKIVKKFDKKFLENNMEFKELIVDALQYNDLYRKKIRFQYISPEYITNFSVNEDENGEGKSMLQRSLFYAKLYLSLLIFKMVSILSKSNDTKIYYIKKSGVDTDVANSLQEVARSIKQKQVSFLDLMNYNSMASKIGNNKEIFMPVGRSGERGIEFDILSGQDIQMNTELMEMLITNAINATGVPSVIMSYINEADYSRTLVMANAKFLGRTVSYQLDFNPQLTEFYKKVIRYCTNIPDNIVDSFEYKLIPPKSLNNNNTQDLVNNTENVVSFLIKARTGEMADQSNDSNRLKDIMFNKVARELMPSLPWGVLDDIYDKSKLELEKEKQILKTSSNDGEDGAYM